MKSKTTNSSDLLPAERRARQLKAQIEVMRLTAAKKSMKAALGVHSAADTGRRNRDWIANNASADLAIIPDSTILNARARQLVRDSWIAKSIGKAFTRNVVGKGITIMPHAKDENGKPLTALNKQAQVQFSRWSLDSRFCDVERRKTFNQMQRLAADEQISVGEHLWMWSYSVPQNSTSPVGLKIQAFEPEQFDLRILSYEGREVRGGVEVDENGAPVAFHIYTRNPNDVLYRHAFFSQRVPATRMFHYFRQDRVLQTRGVTRLASVMNDIRELERYRSATLWRAVMESCIGLIITQPTPGALGGPSQFFQPMVGDMGQTPSGMSTADFVPGMVARLVPGEQVDSFVPQSPGNNYDPFTQLTVRGIGAGVGMSFGQVMRQSDGNYSSARQDMLEDRREWEPEQQLLIDDLIRPTYEKWFNFAALEGKFDGIEGFDMESFMADPRRFYEADYIPPAQSWIDPEKEANAFAVLLQNRLITREEIVAMRGSRFYQVIEKLSVEQNEVEGLNLTLPENQEERDSLREIIKAMLANRLGTIDNLAANVQDTPGMFERAGVPINEQYRPPKLPIVSPPQSTPAPQKGAMNAWPDDDPPCPQPAPPNVPHYRPADIPEKSCATCSFLKGERCSRFNFVVDLGKVCDDWTARTLTDNIGAPNTAKSFPPGPLPGQPDLERRFYPVADPLAPVPDASRT